MLLLLALGLAQAGSCPTGADLARARIREFTRNHCLLEPAASGLCSTDPSRPDTHASGERLHRVFVRSGGPPLRSELLLFLPPGDSSSYQTIGRLGATAGYRTILLGYDNRLDLNDYCHIDPTLAGCHEEIREEINWGRNTHPAVSVGPADSVVHRVEVLLRHLADLDPAFAAYLGPDGPRWERIVLGGYSQGSGHAAYLAKDLPVKSLVLLAGPKDHHHPDPLDYEVIQIDAWPYEPRAVEACAQYGIFTRDWTDELVDDVWGALGLTDRPVDVDTTPRPYGFSHVLSTAATGPGCGEHASLAVDECLPPSLYDAHLYLFCAAGERLGCE